MIPAPLRSSVCRIADLDGAVLRRADRATWALGDYVVGEVVGHVGPGRGVELETGRMARLSPGDRVVGALGDRAATLEVTGRWSDVGADGRMHLLTSGGLIGKVASRSPLVAPAVDLVYAGHLFRGDERLSMAGAVPGGSAAALELPVILIVGSSMSAGKTESARVLIRILRRTGLRVLAAKLTGAARYRDVLSMADAGAIAHFDFVDAGLPSSVCSEPVYVQAIEGLFARMARVPADVAVIEAGASPLEPYNGAAITRLLRDQLRLVVLCASDPYAALGITEAFAGVPVDVVAGIACNTDAGRQLVRKLTGLPALRLIGPGPHLELEAILREAGLLGPGDGGARVPAQEA